jgi:hypothetical protein
MFRLNINKCHSCQTAGNSNFTLFPIVYFFNAYSAQVFIWTHYIFSHPPMFMFIVKHGILTKKGSEKRAFIHVIRENVQNDAQLPTNNSEL